MKSAHLQWLKQIPSLLEIPTPDAPRLLHRIGLMERDTMLPLKAAFIGMILYSFWLGPSRWVSEILSLPDIVVETVQYIFWFYIVISAVLALPMLRVQRLPLALVQWTVVTSSLVDGLFVAAMVLLTGGLDSIVFWLFVGLIIRNAVSLPAGFSQLFLNFAISLCYVLVAVAQIILGNHMEAWILKALGITPEEDIGEPFVLRLAVLWLTAICCYGAQVLLERQRMAAEEAEEFATREGQLRSAGRLAAEFAHQIKNPLAVINNAAYSLQRSLREGKEAAPQQIEIIQEEVARANKVVTQIMGYAQLTEGRVEKLDVRNELERAISQVFPPAVPTGIQVQREYSRWFPPLLMQRGHVLEILVNLLKNAREAQGETGKVLVSAAARPDHAVEISIRDNGPGIPPDKLERIFEAYYTTKERGTGLGLAIVKHNVELYGGTVRVESKLGNGAKFTVLFPAKASIKLSLK